MQFFRAFVEPQLVILYLVLTISTGTLKELILDKKLTVQIITKDRIITAFMLCFLRFIACNNY